MAEGDQPVQRETVGIKLLNVHGSSFEKVKDMKVREVPEEKTAD